MKPTRFKECYDLFQKWILQESGEPFRDFQSGLVEKEEGYKEKIYKEGREKLNFGSWKEARIGKGEILQCAIAAIEIKENNLVGWRDKDKNKLIDAQSDPAATQQTERILFDLYRGNGAPDQVFAALTEAIGRKWPLVSYLFFLKDWENYMPYRPMWFNTAFELLDMKPPIPILGEYTWENYQTYIEGLRSVQAELKKHQVPNVRLIDAHSFCWGLSTYKKKPAPDRGKGPAKTDTIQSDAIKNVILYGPPGTGKTHLCNKLIQLVEEHNSMPAAIEALSKEQTDPWDDQESDGVEDDRVRSLTFHQSYSYEDFIEGFRPVSNGGGDSEASGSPRIRLEAGVFKQFCEDAEEQRDCRFYLIIDEINRGNISKIFGELITLLEEDKRGKSVTLPYSGDTFSIPPNIYVIATMNSTDKSIALVDVALRRRFTFVRFDPQPDLVTDADAHKLMKALNEKIEDKIDKDYQIGHSYFMKVPKEYDLDFLKRYKLLPLIEEYAYANQELHKELLKSIN